MMEEKYLIFGVIVFAMIVGIMVILARREKFAYGNRGVHIGDYLIRERSERRDPRSEHLSYQSYYV